MWFVCVGLVAELLLGADCWLFGIYRWTLFMWDVHIIGVGIKFKVGMLTEKKG